jgi:hypothetical protein
MQGPGFNGQPPVVGNLGLGILAGLFGGCIGLALVLIIAKGPQTKKGAAIGFGLQFVIGIIINVASR